MIQTVSDFESINTQYYFQYKFSKNVAAMAEPSCILSTLFVFVSILLTVIVLAIVFI